MIVFRYLFKETLKTQLSVLLILLLIFMSQNFIRVLSKAVKGSIPTQLVTELMMLNVPNMALLMLPISLFVGILFAHGRLYAESEMTVLKALGLGPRYIMSTALLLALLTGALAIGNTFWLAPWAQRQQIDLLERAKRDPSFTAIEEGRFLSLNSGKLVVYVDELKDKGKDLERIFLLQQATETQGPAIIVAKNGRLSSDDNGLRWVTLQDGHRYAAPLKGDGFNISSFEQYRAWIPLGQEEKDARLEVSSLDWQKLTESDDPKALGEMQWRISLPISILVLTLIVVPLAQVNPRQGRYAKLLPAILLYLSYYLLLSAGRSAMERGTLPAMPGLFSVPLVYLLLFALPLNLGGTRWWQAFRLSVKGRVCP